MDVVLSMLGDVEDSEVCDLACGEGYLSRILGERRARVTGIDLSENLIAHARHQFESSPVHYTVDDAQQTASLTDDAFDAVVCNMALMDIEDLKAAYRSVSRILRGDGLFVFSILHPCFETPQTPRSPSLFADEEGNFLTRQVTRYNDEGKWFSSGSGMLETLGSFHRKLSTYMNALVKAGFTVVEMAEPMLPPGEYRAFVDQWLSMVPRILVAKATKGLSGFND